MLASGKHSIHLVYSQTFCITSGLLKHHTTEEFGKCLPPLEKENYFPCILELCKASCFNPHQSVSDLCLITHLHGCRYFTMRTGFKCFQPLGTGTKSLSIMSYLCHWQFLKKCQYFQKAVLQIRSKTFMSLCTSLS